MAKVKKTTAQNEVTGEIRNVSIHADGSKYFDHVSGSVKFKADDEKVWVVQVNPRSFEYWLTPAVLFLIAVAFTIIGAYQ